MRRPFFLLFTNVLLLLLIIVGRAGASWHQFDSRAATAIDFFTAHLGLVSFDDASHSLQRIRDTSLGSVWSAPGVITGIAIQDSVHAWAVVKNNGLYFGTNGWRSWSNVNSRTDFTIVGATPQSVFLYANHQLYSTSDGVNLFTTVGIAATDSIVAIDYLTPTIIVAVSKTTTYRSFDGGGSWVNMHTNMTGALSVYIDRAHHIFYTGGDELRMSTDSGKTWNVVYAPPDLPSFHELDGQVFGAHDCTGTFYISSGQSHGGSMIRSQSLGQTFEDCDIPPTTSFGILRAWTFDRGSLIYWYDLNGNVYVSRDGLTGLLTDSIGRFITVVGDTITDTLCASPTKPVQIGVSSSVCTGVMIDSITAIRGNGSFITAFTPRTLLGDGMMLHLTYRPKSVGVDSSVLRVWYHSLEWGIRESTDIAVIATVSTLPSKLDATQSLDFGNVHVDSTKRMTLTIANSGCSPLTVDSLISSNPNLFAIPAVHFPATLAGDSTWKLLVSFTPNTTGPMLESLELGTSSGHRFITVQGSGTQELSGVGEYPTGEIPLISPNPANDVVHLHGVQQGATVTLYDLLGREILSSQDAILNVKDVPAGMYFLHIGTHVTRLLIQH